MEARIELRTTREFLDKIDAWREQQMSKPSRSEAIRRLIEKAIDLDKSHGL